MGAFAQRFGCEWRCGRQPWLLGAAVLLSLFLSLAVGVPRVWAAGPLQWELLDRQGGRWGLVLFEQSAPPAERAWRLRLHARSGALALDHARPLQLQDDLGGLWQLPNCSAELVVDATQSPPASSAQFDLQTLWPRPSDAFPLRLRLPLLDADRDLVLGPAQVQALHALP